MVIVVLCHKDFAKTEMAMSISPQIAKLVFGGEVGIPPAVQSASQSVLSKYLGDYVLPSGAKIRVTSENGTLTLAPDGQEAIELLAYPNAGEPSLNERLNERAGRIMSAMLRGDFKPAEEALAEQSESRLKRMKGLLEARIAELNKEIGPLTGVEFIGTVPRIPDSHGEKTADNTTVLIKGQKGNWSLAMTWQNGKLIGFRPSGSMGRLRVPFLALSLSEFAGYHLFIARNVGASFDVDGKGQAKALKIKTFGKETFLQKLR